MYKEESKGASERFSNLLFLCKVVVGTQMFAPLKFFVVQLLSHV